MVRVSCSENGGRVGCVVVLNFIYTLFINLFRYNSRVILYIINRHLIINKIKYNYKTIKQDFSYQEQLDDFIHYKSNAYKILQNNKCDYYC